METNFQNAVTIAIVGFSSVLTILTLYALMITVIKKLNAVAEFRQRKKIKNVTEPVVKNTIDAETIAVISAAINVAMNERVVIKKIQVANPISYNATLSNFFKTKIFQANNLHLQKRRK